MARCFSREGMPKSSLAGMLFRGTILLKTGPDLLANSPLLAREQSQHHA
jgi:hypothetical protein